MMTLEKFYIVPLIIYNMNNDYNENNLYVNFIKLKDERYAISERIKTDFNGKFFEIESFINDNNIPYEFRKLDYNEIWIDPNLSPIS